MALGGGLVAAAAGAWFLHDAGLWPLAAWVVASSVVTALLFAVDKLLARRGARRVSERALLGMSLAGGSPGALVAMPLLRHKTVKSAFRRSFAAILVVQALALAAWWWWGTRPD